jgi:hypothetical protein
VRSNFDVSLTLVPAARLAALCLALALASRWLARRVQDRRWESAWRDGEEIQPTDPLLYEVLRERLHESHDCCRLGCTDWAGRCRGCA